MWAYLLKVSFWWFVSIVKFVLAPFLMIFNEKEHWSWLETIIVTSSGAALGVFIFFHFGEGIFNWLAHHTGTRKRAFSKLNRRLVRLKWRYGIKGLMLISGLISVPLASLVAAKFYRHDHNALPLMITGFFFWSIALSTAAYFGNEFFREILAPLFRS